MMDPPLINLYLIKNQLLNMRNLNVLIERGRCNGFKRKLLLVNVPPPILLFKSFTV